MTPQEKATELVEFYKAITEPNNEPPYYNTPIVCALKVVDELEKHERYLESVFQEEFYDILRQEQYWKEVKECIINY